MATLAERRQARLYHSLTFFVPPPETVYYSDGLFYSGEDLFDDEPNYDAAAEEGFVNLENANLGTNPKNTWCNWHLVPSSRPVFSPPALTTHYVEIPGYNGYLDLTKSLSNHIMGARDGSVNFYVMNDYGHWEERYNELLSYIHGNLLRVVLDDNPNFYYEGRWSVESWTNNNDGICSSVSFHYYLQPGRKPIP